MKGILVKKIFKTIGIVVGSVLGFVGGTVGVMAAMGKFKTPIVYPTMLQFEVSEETVVQTRTYDPKIEWNEQFADKQNAPDIFSYKLVGTTSDSDEQVNKTKCYIWFGDINSSKLITLCDKEGHPLQKQTNNRYVVDCNTDLYYMINKVDENDTTINGKVLLNARSFSNKAETATPYTLYIDRKIDNVVVAYEGSEINEARQNIKIGLNTDFKFQYAVTTPLSLRPFKKESAKEIELYFDVTNFDEDFGTDYFLVTPESCVDNNPASPVANILDYVDEDGDGNGVYKFQSLEAGEYNFVIAVFATYEDKLKFEPKNTQNPNFEKVQKMLSTKLCVTVENIEITEVGFNGDEIVLDLYAENSIYLNNDEAPINNLGLYMKKNELFDYTRLNEVHIRDIHNIENLLTNDEVKFQTLGEEGKTIIYNEGWIDIDANEITLNHSTVTLYKDETKQISVINSVTYNGEEYYCCNGVGVSVSETNTDIKLLQPGSYLNFYVENADKTYELYNLNAEIDEYGQGVNKYWQVIPKEIPEGNLKLGVLVANSSGTFKIGTFFKTINCGIKENDFNATFKDYADENIVFTVSENKRTINANITFSATGINYPIVNYSNIISNIIGSYKSFVYVIEKVDNPFVETVPNLIVTVDDTEYLVVGYLENGKFINKIKLKENVSKDNKTTTLKLLQLKNGYGETAEDFIKTLLESTETVIIQDNAKLLIDFDIELQASYKLNASLLRYQHGTGESLSTYGVKTYEVYENTGEHFVLISSINTEMLAKIYEFYAIDSSCLETSITTGEDKTERIEKGDARIDDNQENLIFPYNVKNELAKPNVITMTVVINGIEFSVGSVSILSGVPNSIILRTSENKYITLNQSSSDITNTLKVDLHHNKDGFGYVFSIGEETEIEPANIFNECLKFGGFGFQDADTNINKGQSLKIKYLSENKEIFNTDKITFEEDGTLNLLNGLVGKTGQVTLEIRITGTSRQISGYINVITNTDGFSLSLTDDKTEQYTYTSDPNLSEFVKLNYEGTELTNSLTNLVQITDVKCRSYGDGELISSKTIVDNYITKWELKKGENTVLSITNDDMIGWKFEKNNSYIPLTIQFTVKTVAGDKEIILHFKSTVSIGVNSNWSNRTIYTDTNILIEKLFDVERRNGISASVSFEIDSASSEKATIDDGKLKATNIGQFKIIPVVDGKQLSTQGFMFQAVPNVKVSNIKEEGLKSDTEYSISDIFTLKKYDTDANKTYEMYYSESDLVNFDSYNNLSIEIVSNPESLLSWSNSKLSVDNISVLGESYNASIILKYDDYELCVLNLTINNKYTVSDSLSEEIRALNEIYLDTSLQIYLQDIIECSDFKLTDITAEGVEINISKDGNNITKFSINQIFNDIEDITFKFTFTNGATTLTYNKKITIKPYIPEIKTELDEVYSGTEIDLFNLFYGGKVLQPTVRDSAIKQLYITDILDNEENSIIEDVVQSGWVVGGAGYRNGVENPSYEVILKEIAGESKEVFIQFIVTYDNNTTYSYSAPLTILNRQSISEPNYPENDIKLTNGEFEFLIGYENDANEILSHNASNELLHDSVYKLYNLKYEPILIYTDKANVINFKQDNIKNIKRFIVGNRNDDNTSTDLTIELIAYQSNSGVKDYISNIVCGTNTVSFGTAKIGLFGTLIFKVSTDSGNYKYYYIYVYCNGDTASINHKNNIEISVADSSNLPVDSNTTIDCKIVDNTTTYQTLIGSINNFEAIFKAKYNSNVVKLYEYNGESATALTESDIVSLAVEYQTKIIGLVMLDGVHVYFFGTITLYIQPSTAVELKNDSVKCEVPNGEFVGEISANATSVECPFTGNWEAEFVNESGETEEENKFATINNSAVLTIVSRTLEDIVIRVKYTRENGTIVYVAYTYEATTLPDENTATIIVGNFNEEGTFNNVIYLNDSNNCATYFGNYAGECEITECTNAEFDPDTKELRFIQGPIEKEAIITIKYLNIEGKPTRTFKFNVLPGIKFVTSGGENSGATTNTRRKTDKLETGLYDSNVGSKLEVNVKTENNITRYKVGGITIYTSLSDTELKLSFNDSRYYAGGVIAGDETSVIINSTQDINFTHSANDHALTMTIKVMEGTNEVATRDMFLTITKTYSGLQVKYLVESADHEVDHENVVKNTSFNLYTKMLDEGRLVLLDVDGNPVSNVRLRDIGFDQDDNPNKLIFTLSTDSPATISSNTITFYNVTSNRDCKLYINNDAGIEKNTVVYIYQVMAGEKVDDLDYSNTNGYYANTYLSFALNAETNEGQEFTIGKMVDANSSILLVDYKDNSDQSLIPDENNDNYVTLDGTQLKVYLTDDGNVKLSIKSSGTNKLQTFKLSLGGVNGNETIVKDLIIVLSKYNVETKYSSINPDKVYAGNKVILAGNINTENNKLGGNDIGDENLTYQLINSKYSYGGSSYETTEYINKLFTYNKDNKSILFNAVNQDILAEINFYVVTGNYIISTVQYYVNVKLNLRYVVNKDTTGTLNTNFVLTLPESAANFPITVPFKDCADIDTNSYKTTSQITVYKALGLELRKILADNLDVARSNIIVEINSCNDSDAVEVSNVGIIFKKDYSGDLELKLSVDTNFGRYVEYWTIYVTPIIDIKLAKSTDTILKNGNSQPFESGEEVRLISTILNTNEPDVGITVQIDNTFDTSINEATIKSDYKILAYDIKLEDKNAEDLYKNASENYNDLFVAYGSNGETTQSPFTFNVTLPRVPGTLEDQSYLVVYKVYLEYCGLSSDANNVEFCYVAYKVINHQRVSSYTYEIEGETYSSKKINVSSGVDGTFLDLFYYSDDTNKYIDGNIHSVFQSDFDSNDDFDTFINQFKGQKCVYIKKNGSEEEVAFTLMLKDTNRYGIDLSENNRILFNNELIGTLSLKINNVAHVVLEGFMLYADNTMQIKSNNGKGYTISELGLTNYFIPNERYNSSISIIGVGESAENEWINGSSQDSSPVDGNEVGTIMIPNGDGDNNEYSVYEVTYIGTTSNNSSYYSIQSNYYYIKSDKALIIPHFGGVETNCYSVSYIPNADGNVVLNLDEAVYVWSMNINYGMVHNLPTGYDIAIDESSIITHNTQNKSININANELINYKLENPDETVYRNQEITITVNGVSLKMVIQFYLPQMTTYETSYIADSDIVFTNLFDALQPLNNADNDYIEEQNLSSGTITLNKEKVNQYFENPTVNELVITFSNNYKSIIKLVVLRESAN